MSGRTSATANINAFLLEAISAPPSSDGDEASFSLDIKNIPHSVRLLELSVEQFQTLLAIIRSKPTKQATVRPARSDALMTLERCEGLQIVLAEKRALVYMPQTVEELGKLCRNIRELSIALTADTTAYFAAFRAMPHLKFLGLNMWGNGANTFFHELVVSEQELPVLTVTDLRVKADMVGWNLDNSIKAFTGMAKYVPFCGAASSATADHLQKAVERNACSLFSRFPSVAYLGVKSWSVLEAMDLVSCLRSKRLLPLLQELEVSDVPRSSVCRIDQLLDVVDCRRGFLPTTVTLLVNNLAVTTDWQKRLRRALAVGSTATFAVKGRVISKHALFALVKQQPPLRLLESASAEAVRISAKKRPAPVTREDQVDVQMQFVEEVTSDRFFNWRLPLC